MKKYLLTSSLLAGAVLAANANLIIEETFNYPDQAALFSAYENSAANANVQNLGTRFGEDPAASPFGYSGKEFYIGGNNMTLGRDFTTSSDTTYYFSYTFELDDVGGINTVSFFDTAANTGGEALVLGTNQDNTFGVGYADADGSAQQTTLSADTEYFVVGSFSVTAAGEFSIGADIYTGSGLPATITEPASWTHTASQAGGAGSTISSIRFRGTRYDPGSGLVSSPNSYYESFRIGTEFADVVPEPSSYALISGFLALGWIMIRRRK